MEFKSATRIFYKLSSRPHLLVLHSNQLSWSLHPWYRRRGYNINVLSSRGRWNFLFDNCWSSQLRFCLWGDNKMSVDCLPLLFKCCLAVALPTGPLNPNFAMEETTQRSLLEGEREFLIWQLMVFATRILPLARQQIVRGLFVTPLFMSYLAVAFLAGPLNQNFAMEEIIHCLWTICYYHTTGLWYWSHVCSHLVAHRE